MAKGFELRHDDDYEYRLDFEKDGSVMLDCPEAFIQFADAIEDMVLVTEDGPFDHYIRMATGIRANPSKKQIALIFDESTGWAVARFINSRADRSRQIGESMVQYLSPLFEDIEDEH